MNSFHVMIVLQNLHTLLVYSTCSKDIRINAIYYMYLNCTYTCKKLVLLELAWATSQCSEYLPVMAVKTEFMKEDFPTPYSPTIKITLDFFSCLEFSDNLRIDLLILFFLLQNKNNTIYCPRFTIFTIQKSVIKYHTLICSLWGKKQIFCPQRQQVFFEE